MYLHYIASHTMITFLHCKCPMFILNILLFRNSVYYWLMFLLNIAQCKGPMTTFNVLQKLILYFNVWKLTLQRSHVHIKCFNLQKLIVLLHLNVFKLKFHGMITFSTLKIITLNVLQKLRQPDSWKLILVRVGRISTEIGNGCSTQGNFNQCSSQDNSNWNVRKRLEKIELSVNSEVGSLMLN